MSELEDEVNDILEMPCPWCGTPMESFENVEVGEDFPYVRSYKCPDCGAVLSSPRIETEDKDE